MKAVGCWGTDVNKKIILKLGLGTSLLLALVGCREIEGVDYLNAGHPADPGAMAGRPLPMSRALVSENEDVRPELDGIASGPVLTGGRAASAPAPAMDHSMMDHSKMNMGGQ